MIQRKTQTGEYWQTLTLSADDIEFLRNKLLDAEKPVPTRDLALALITEHCRQEEARLRAELSRGTLYQPKKRYAVGDTVIFPAFNFRLGKVIDVRPGQNPEYGEFEVITVDFGPDRRQRAFAAALNAPHKLNADIPDLLVAGDLASPEKLLTTVAAGVPALLRNALANHPDFVSFEDRWMLRQLMAEIHIGHLNIAEAVIEMNNTALTTEALLAELDLPAEIKPEVLAFSLHSALMNDGRFDQVGTGKVRRWYLKRLEPPGALVVPPALVYEPIPYDPSDLPPALARLAWELDDEWSEDLVGPTAERAAATTATLLLTYPHLVSGTLPLNRRARPFFPPGLGTRTMVTLIDGRWGNRFQAWVNHEGRYIIGLQPWFEKHKLPAGAYITLERRPDTDEVVVDFRPKRMRREWTRWAQVDEEMKVDIQLRKQEIACEYDELMIIGDDRNEAIMKLRADYARVPLADLVFEIFTELAGLSGTVHAKTVYSAVNVLRRCTPEPIFALLATDKRLEQTDEYTFRLVA